MTECAWIVRSERRMQTLVHDQFYPATERIGFLSSSPESIVKAYGDWLRNWATRSRSPPLTP